MQPAHPVDVPKSVVTPARSGRVVALVTAAGLLAALLAWASGEALYGFYPPANEETLLYQVPVIQPTPRTLESAHAKNAALAFGVFGGLLGLMLGSVGGLLRRAPRAAVGAGLLGMILGGVFGVGLTLALTPILWKAMTAVTNGIVTGQNDIITPIWVHSLIWGSLGASAGLALGVGHGGGPGVWLRAALAGLIGAVLGTVVFEILGASLFPLEKTTLPLALDRWARLLARLLVGVPAALLAARELVSTKTQIANPSAS
jgi:hypothetical protein